MIEQHADEDGRLALWLTGGGAQVRHASAMGGGDAGEVLDALLGDDPNTSR